VVDSTAIVLCTYNGARYLPAQLDSLLRQTVPVDRIEVWDDGSTDDTLAVVSAYSDRLPLHLRRNEQTLGAVANFAQALAATSAQIVFLCDQDDIWEPYKVERMLKLLAADPAMLLLGTDAHIVGTTGARTGRTLLQRLSAQAATSEGGALLVERLLRRNFVTGATIAVRRRLLDVALPVPDGCWHDEWLGLAAAALGALRWLDEPLMRYRLHETNAAGLKQTGVRATARGAVQGGLRHHAWKAAKLGALKARLQAMSCVVPLAHLALVDEAADFWARRAELPGSRLARLPFVASHWADGSYKRFGDGLRSAARDLLL
jgi:glycosyltransferase involved in cell wall biosynthesis